MDTHTHLYLDEFEGDREAMMERAREAGVKHMILPNIDRESLNPMMAMVDAYPGVCFPMAGLHPTSVKGDFAAQMDPRICLFRKGFRDRRVWIGPVLG
ncbi:MAG: TatD family hydrolase [Bacteroidales bacterium]